VEELEAQCGRKARRTVMGVKTEEGTVWSLPAGKVASASAKMWNRLAGDGARVIAQLDDDESFRDRVAEFMFRGGFNPTCFQKIAQEIMGKNFLGVPDAIRHFGVHLAAEQEKALSEVAFPENVLRECAKTHILFPGFPLTILDVRAKMPHGHFCSYEDAWYNSQPFASSALILRWYLLRKEAVADSFSKPFADQQKLLLATEEVPSACEVVYSTMLYERVTGIRLFKSCYVRCRDLYSDGSRVVVGSFDSSGFHVGYWGGDDSDNDLGCSSARKVQS